MNQKRPQWPYIRRTFLVELTALLVGLHGGFLLATTLLDQLMLRRAGHEAVIFDVQLLLGLSLMYLSSRLFRRKWIAWVVAIGVYAFIFGLYTLPFLATILHHQSDLDRWVKAVAMPVTIVGFLLAERRQFVVRNDFMVFRSSLKFAAIILLAAFLYGTSGFLLMDRHDFHKELSVAEAMHRTVDQFDLTTNHPLPPRTRRAHVFVDSLSVVSTGAVAYVIVSLFAPFRARFHDAGPDIRTMTELLTKYKAASEDFFKLWPHDKQYYFNTQKTAGLAFHAYKGVALCLGDPVGHHAAVRALMASFDNVCYQNDWLPAFIHTEPGRRKLYEQFGFTLQKIGEEAVVDIAHYDAEVRSKKYFRHIRNRFEREGYTAELLTPPYDNTVLDRLKTISDEWLDRPGRVERGFVMGNYSREYLQLCPILVARDADGTIQGFMNQVPAPFDREEATYDMLRQTDSSLGNTNDFMLMSFIDAMREAGYARVNLGLAPLVGIDDVPDENRTVIDNFLRFAYANGDRFYSFSGLHRFKDKYEPQWRDRFVAYRGGVRGFARTTNALLRAMQIKQR